MSPPIILNSVDDMTLANAEKIAFDHAEVQISDQAAERIEVMVAALEMAIAQRRPIDVIHHSDHGCQYTSYAFGKRCREAGVMPSMGTVGDAYDNAMAESFFATLERSPLVCSIIKSTTSVLARAPAYKHQQISLALECAVSQRAVQR